MESDLNQCGDQFLADSRFLLSLGAPIDNPHELRNWVNAYRRAIEIPDSELLSRMEGILKSAIEQVNRDETGSCSPVPGQPRRLAAADMSVAGGVSPSNTLSVTETWCSLKDEKCNFFPLLSDPLGRIFVRAPQPMSEVPLCVALLINNKRYVLCRSVDTEFTEIVELTEADLDATSDLEGVIEGRWEY